MENTPFILMAVNSLSRKFIPQDEFEISVKDDGEIGTTSTNIITGYYNVAIDPKCIEFEYADVKVNNIGEPRTANTPYAAPVGNAFDPLVKESEELKVSKYIVYNFSQQKAFSIINKYPGSILYKVWPYCVLSKLLT